MKCSTRKQSGKYEIREIEDPSQMKMTFHFPKKSFFEKNISNFVIGEVRTQEFKNFGRL